MPSRSLTGVIAAAVAAVAVLLALGLGSASTPPASAAPGSTAGDGTTDERPNVVLIESDDQTLDSMRFMPHTEQLIGEKGATFPVSIASWPLCCPSRATLLTGQYAHNHGVLGNKDVPLGGFDRLDSETALPVWMENAGYYTAHIGKYLNGYEESPVGVPPGWTEWHGSKDTYKFYGYTLLEDGENVQYGNPLEDPDNPADPASYSTDVYTDKAVEIIDRRAQDPEPFFLSLAYLAPHSGAPQPNQGSGPSVCAGSAKPAKRHIGDLAAEPTPVPPNFNEADTSDKPLSIRRRAPLTEEQLLRIDRSFHCRAESLLAIDEGVQRIVGALRKSGELKNTLIIYTSDNGFFGGEHRIPNGKNRVYEEAARVPLLMRGPEIPEGVTVEEMAVNTDLAPTLADVAGAFPLVEVDGRSLIPLAQRPDRYRGREVLIEQFSSIGEDGEPAGIQYSAIRTERYKYVENATGEVELYDLELDPYELENQRRNPDYQKVKLALAGRLATLRDCAGSECRLKPRLTLEISGKQEPKRNGNGLKECLLPDSVTAKLPRKTDEMPLVEAEFRVEGRRAGDVVEPPFETRLRPSLLKAARKPQISVDATLLDGRMITITSRIKICS